MRRAIRNGSRAVDADDDRKVVQADVMEDVVQCALQECGIDGDDGAEALAGEAGREGDGVGFRDACVETTFWILFHKFFETSSLEHCRGDDGHFWVLFCQRCDGLREGVGEGRARGFFQRFAGGDVEGGDAMVVVRFRFGGLVAFSFDGQQMEEDRAVRRQFGQDAAEFADVVAVDGTEIAKPKFLEENAIGHEEAFEGVFCAAEEAFECREAFTTGTE